MGRSSSTRRDLREVRQAFLVLLAALTFAVATLGINVVANFVSPAFDFANVAPKHITFKKSVMIAAFIALLLYPLAPLDNAPSLRQRHRLDDGPDLRRGRRRLLPPLARPS